jgi:hypothetical protein
MRVDRSRRLGRLKLNPATGEASPRGAGRWDRSGAREEGDAIGAVAAPLVRLRGLRLAWAAGVR